MNALLRRALPLAILPLLAASGACDLVTAGMHSEATAQWHKSYQLAPNGRVEIDNTNGKIDVEPATDNTVDVVAIKKAHGADDNAAKAALNDITIAEDASPSSVKIETKLPSRNGGFHLFGGGNLQVEYHVKVPAGVQVHVSNTNGGIDLTGVQGSVVAETTNGGIDARDISGAIQAETTNGGVDVDLARVADGGVTLGCTNGAVSLRLPKDSKATISARVTNGGIDTGNLAIDASGDNTRRRFDGRLNGGGPRIELETTNGAVSISGK
jgi:hypothetical protein